MANNERGEVRLDAGEQSYVLRFSTNAMCDLEDLFGEPFSQIVERLTKPDEISLSDLRKLLWGAIADTVPEWSEPSRDTLRAVGVGRRCCWPAGGDSKDRRSCRGGVPGTGRKAGKETAPDESRIIWRDLLVDYISAGFDPDHFWRITLREYIDHMTGAAKRLERDQHARAWSAHTTALLSRVDGKRFPKLEDMTRPKGGAAKSPAEMALIARAWDAAINKGPH